MKDGAEIAIVEEAIQSLVDDTQPSDRNLLLLLRGFASLAFKKNQSKQSWLEERFAMLDDILAESPAFQQIEKKAIEKGLEKGLKQGLEQGLTKGLEQGIKQTHKQQLEVLVDECFPGLQNFVKTHIEQLINVADFDHCYLKLARMQTSQQAQQFLASMRKH